MKNIQSLHDIIKYSEFSKKIQIYFGSRTVGEDYDPYEQNYEYETNELNPMTIKAYVTQVSPTQLVYKQYGLDKQGAVEIITEGKYESWFEDAVKITIDSVEYEVYRDAVGGRSLITKRPNKLMRVVLTRK